MPATLQFDAITITPAELEDHIARVAGGLSALGIAENDTVAIMMRNDPAFLEAMLGARLVGAYYCAINWHFKADEAGFILRDCEAKALIVHADLVAQIQSAIPPALPVIVVEPHGVTVETGDKGPHRVPTNRVTWPDWLSRQPRYAGPAWFPRGNMAYTSGTTGRPKGVRRTPPPHAHTEQAMRRMAALNLEINGIGAGMRALLSGPMYHSAPNAYAVQSALVGELLVLEARFDAERTLALIEKHKLTHAYLVPTMFVRMLRLPDETQRKYDVSSMRFVACTGSPCAPAVKRAMIEWWGPVIHESYASSEAGFITHINSEEALSRPGSVGRPATGAEIRILDDQGESVPAGETGVIYARQPAYTDFTYAHQPEARQSIERDGLVSVGDMGYLDEDGYLYISDRKSDMVISGGVNIYPAEIEAVLISMPGVADCAVFGIPDEEFGEALAAAVQLREGYSQEHSAVRDYLAGRIANYKVPKVVAFHAQLPREDSGKIFKRRLRAPYWEGVKRRI